MLGIAGILLFLAVWELASRTGIVNPRFLPPASEVLLQLGRNFVSADFWTAVGQTMTSWAIGLAIAAAAATVIGFIIGGSDFLRRATHTTIEFLRPIPSVALIPLAVLLFGVSIESSLLLIVYASFWQILIQVLYGTADVDNVAMDTARSYGLGWWARVRHVVWPTTLPYLITGLRLGAAVALVLAITAELVIGTEGLGKQIELNRSGGSVVPMYALVIATGLIGVVINIGMRFVERRALRWHSSVRGDVAV
ncbi:ABC transporter permease [Salinibacterium sp. SYSU T00001]|uniref:ABC transporter permease n=1 Tax=Homoserinimonas sedimenticola TaxID=2986805 RepID=UPI0022357F24|nr:ABC transporter permease [Salinibacterium sedimenticola]MCW4386678.1 ABC transporter permease [Salinibacterium sedimenticola]